MKRNHPQGINIYTNDFFTYTPMDPNILGNHNIF